MARVPGSRYKDMGGRQMEPMLGEGFTCIIEVSNLLQPEYFAYISVKLEDGNIMVRF